MKMTEATLEQRISFEIAKHFPFLKLRDITHQETFTIKVGHRQHTINSKFAKGRLDIMVRHKGKPLAIFELKAHNIPVTNDDINQCVSYARLTDPITPLAILSNGKESKVINAYDKSSIGHKLDSAKSLNTIIENAGNIASSELDSAIEILLGIDNDFWNKVIENINMPYFVKQTGSITELEYPLCDDFQIEREIAKELLRKLQSERLAILKGNPFSGKTNVVYQLCKLAEKNENSIPLYIDMSEPQNIFQYLANQFSALLSTPISKDNFRHWLINSLCKTNKHQLFSINQNNSFSILLVMNEQIYSDLKFIKGKAKLSTIGSACVSSLVPLSNKEFETAFQMIDFKFKIRFHHGSQYNIDYRNPAIVRFLLSTACVQEASDYDEATRLLIPSLIDDRMLVAYWSNLSDDIKSGYREFAKFVIKQKDEVKDPKKNLMIYNSGILFTSVTNKVLELKSIQNLLVSGYFKKETLLDGQQYLYPSLPNAISVAAAYEIKELIMIRDDDIIYSHLIEYSQLFPKRYIVEHCLSY